MPAIGLPNETAVAIFRSHLPILRVGAYMVGAAGLLNLIARVVA